MPNGQVYETNSALTTFVVDKARGLASTGALISRVFLPPTAVKTRIGRVFYSSGEFIRSEDDTRAPGTIGKMSTTEGTFSDYALKQHAWTEFVVLEEGEESALIGLDLQQQRSADALNKVMIAREQRFVDIIAASGNFGHSDVTTAAKRWDVFAAADSDPLADLRSLVAAMSPVVPSHLLVPYDVQIKTAGHPALVELQKYTNPNMLTVAGWPHVILGMKVVTANAPALTSNKGQTDTFGNLYTDTVVAAFVGGAEASNTLWGWGRSLTYKNSDNLVVDTWNADPEMVSYFRTRDTGSKELIVSAACAGRITLTCSAT